MKILWFSNSILANTSSNSTGTWLQTMSSALLNKGVTLCNITQSCQVNDIVLSEEGGLQQWILPVYKLNNHGLPSQNNIRNIQSIVAGFNPDIIHIWGTEFYWGLLTARGFIKGNILIEIEGIMSSCAEVYYGGLDFFDILKTIRLKELILPSRCIIAQKRFFSKWGRFEREMLVNHHSISTQSDWVRSWIRPYLKRGTKIFNTGLIIRSAFYTAPHWMPHQRLEKKIFCVSSGSDPYKCIHTIIKALSILKREYPNLSLLIAGDFSKGRPSYRVPGYVKYLRSLIKKLELSDSVIFLGPLTAPMIKQVMLDSDAMVIASAVESYSMALAESMAVGLPAVVSYAGAMPELAEDNESALFFPCYDFRTCASKIQALLSSVDLSCRISRAAIARAESRNTDVVVVEKQLEIYNCLLSDSTKE